VELNRTIVLLDADALERGEPILKATKFTVVDSVVQDVRHALTGYKSESFRVSMAIPEPPFVPDEPTPEPPTEEPTEPAEPVEG